MLQSYPITEGRPAGDFYPTDPEATKALLNVEEFSLQVWEPACGNGALSEILKEHCYNVYATDLYDRGYGDSPIDFLETNPGHFQGDIITNPPYGKIMPGKKFAFQLFAEHALKHNCQKVALFGDLSFLEGQERKKLYDVTPPARVWVLSFRAAWWRNGIPEGKGKGKNRAFAWYIWDKTHEGPPTLGWL